MHGPSPVAEKGTGDKRTLVGWCSWEKGQVQGREIEGKRPDAEMTGEEEEEGSRRSEKKEKTERKGPRKAESTSSSWTLGQSSSSSSRGDRCGRECRSHGTIDSMPEGMTVQTILPQIG
ncbi:hypothetical protein BO78DRAFT_32240 [Aspergillus sclerotiicarbonarius CBS 121057]|uniref:Uncharacterized protein n=1 Tax=Aspergillus sclerotiicarbonarius (strain CBS 121057 / IBT 28362) TaxID=1448318 RepID=A0A319EJT9_ASPSB|nr:hypothetical protein BO78DRAFT_32240 [Aspergillus sclerotiicarbonarius CBS 121057]